jgi:superfamily II DNA or RNA helicase
MQLIMSKFEPILKEDDVSKVLIVTDWLQDIQAMRDWFKRRYKQYSCGTYCMLIDKKAEREKQLEARIIIGTVGSMQNGKDIPNLRAIFPLTQFSSTIVARQLLGRLRPIKDKHVFYWDICDRGVYDTIRERKSRDSVFRERAANEIREEFIDLARY